MHIETSNLHDLAQRGARYLRLVGEKLMRRRPRLTVNVYRILENKIGATHKLVVTRPHPRQLPASKCPPGVIRCVYADEKNFVEFTDNPEGRERAEQWLADRAELAKQALPTSVTTVPIGRAYKNFVQRRTEAAESGSLYDRKPNKQKERTTMAKKPSNSTASEKDTQNGITRPREGSTTRKVWDIADAKDGVRADVLAECAKRKVNPATAMTQFGKWRQYHGLVGRTAPKGKGKPTAPKRKPAPPKRKPSAPKVAPAAPATE